MQNVGKDIAIGVLNNATDNDVDYLKSILEGKVVGIENANSMKDIQKLNGVIPVLTNHYGKSIIKPLYQILDTKINKALLEENTKFIESVYTQMEESANGNRIKLLPPSAYVSELRRLGKQSLTKAEYKEALRKYGDNGSDIASELHGR